VLKIGSNVGIKAVAEFVTVVVTVAELDIYWSGCSPKLWLKCAIGPRSDQKKGDGAIVEQDDSEKY